jgi:PqqD family protein of HPr-rel-A system
MRKKEGIYWYAPDAGAFLWEHGEDESILFDPRSGQTHLLTAVAVEVLRYLSQEPHNQAQLMGKLADVFDIPSQAEFAEHTKELLAQFVASGLIERFP